jgi:integrase
MTMTDAIKKPRLNDLALKGAKPWDKVYSSEREKGMYLEIQPSGAKLWRLQYTRPGTGVRNTCSLGVYPYISLAQARKLRDQALEDIALGLDPVYKRKEDKAAKVRAANNTFQKMAELWLEKKKKEIRDNSYAKLVARVENHIKPHLYKKTIDSITAQDVISICLNIVTARHINTAHYVLRIIDNILSFAVAHGHAPHNVAYGIKQVLPKKPKVKNRTAITNDTRKLAEVMRSIYSNTTIGIAPLSAIKLTIMLAVRTTDMRFMKWSDIDLEEAKWKFVTSKNSRETVIPLPLQSIEILKDLKPLTGTSEYVFPHRTDASKPMGQHFMLASLRTIGIDNTTQSMHGFKATFRTMNDELLGADPRMLEIALDHGEKGNYNGAYARGEFFEPRKAMFQQWADFLDQLRLGDNVLPFTKRMAA